MDKVGKKTNISKKQYKKLVAEIERTPLVSPTALTAVAFIAIASLLAGALIWFAKTTPGNLIKTTGTVTSVTGGLIDATGTKQTYVNYSFQTHDGQAVTARQPAGELSYESGQTISVGYHPKNPNYTRNLSDNTPPAFSLYLWTLPGLLAAGLVAVAGWHYRQRQELIWDAAEAADVNEAE